MLSSSALRLAVAVAQAAGRGATTNQVASATQHLKSVAEAARLTGAQVGSSFPERKSSFRDDASSYESLAGAALDAAGFVSEASRRGVRFPALQSALSAAWASNVKSNQDDDGDTSRTLAVACSIATLAASPIEDTKVARATAAVLTVTMPPLTCSASAEFAAEMASCALAVALSPPTNTVDKHIDLRCALIFARFFELTADSHADLRAAAVPLLRGLLDEFEAMDRGDVSTILRLASQLKLWDTLAPEFLVGVAAQSGLFDVAEDLVVASIEARGVAPNAAATTLVTAALAASRFRQANLVARRFGLSTRFPEAADLHARDTVSKPHFPSRLVESLVDDAAEFTDATRAAQLRVFAVDKLVSKGEFAVALELSLRWGLCKDGESQQQVLETRLAASRAAKRSATISFDDDFVALLAPRCVVDTPEGLVEGLKILLGRSQSKENVVVGLDVEWESQLHTRTKKRQKWSQNAAESSEGSSSSPQEARASQGLKPIAALLQLATKSSVLLCDVTALSQTPTGRLTFASSIGTLLADESVTKLGFGIGQDVSVLKRTIGKFAEGAAEGEDTGIFTLPADKSVVDIGSAGRTLAPRLKGRGLAEFAFEFLGKPLNKTEQCSNWSIRPLRESQLEYAALDAWVPVAIMERIQMISSTKPDMPFSLDTETDRECDRANNMESMIKKEA